MRERGMTAGATSIAGVELRPVTALSLSWMQRNKLFDDDIGDLMQKTAAFVFLHTLPKSEIRAVVNDKDKFADAVDEWIDKNIQHHSQLEPYAEAMNSAMNEYLAAISHAPTDTAKHVGAKN